MLRTEGQLAWAEVRGADRRRQHKSHVTPPILYDCASPQNKLPSSPPLSPSTHMRGQDAGECGAELCPGSAGMALLLTTSSFVPSPHKPGSPGKAGRGKRAPRYVSTDSEVTPLVLLDPSRQQPGQGRYRMETCAKRTSCHSSRDGALTQRVGSIGNRGRRIGGTRKLRQQSFQQVLQQTRTDN